MRFSVFWGLNWGQKFVSFIPENVDFIQLLIYQSQSIPTSKYEQNIYDEN